MTANNAHPMEVTVPSGDRKLHSVNEAEGRSGDNKMAETRRVDINIEIPDNSKLRHGGLIYGINERPPWISAWILALQHFSIALSGCLTIPYLLSGPLCLDQDGLTKLISTTLFVCGVSTILQTSFGVRLPIVQGPGGIFLVAVLPILQMKGDCPQITANATTEAKELLQQESYSRMNEIQGALLIAAVVQSLIGFTGLVGFLSRYIGPIPIGVTIANVCFSLVPVIIQTCQQHWGTAVPTIILIIIFSQFLGKRKLNFRGWGFFQRLFTFFPFILAIAVMWMVSAILTLTNVFPDNPKIYGYFGRTDLGFDVVTSSPWITVSYPGQWGAPTFSIAGVAGMVASSFASMLQSIGDYHACALMAEIKPPPSHAVNRGIGIGGVICLLAASCGTGVGFTSYTGNVAIIPLTKVASRVVIYLSGATFIVIGMFTKFSAFSSTIPAPLIGGTVAVLMGMIAGIGLSNLKKVKMDSSRNMLIVGFSFFLSLGVPGYLNMNPGVIKTGVSSLDQLLTVILSNGMLVGGVTALVLDITISGTPEERNLGTNLAESNQRLGETDMEPKKNNKDMKSDYDLPIGMSWIQGVKLLKYVPFCPTFKGLK